MSDETTTTITTTTTDKPLSEERLAVMRAMITLTDVGDAQFNAITDLLAEVERLRTYSDNLLSLSVAALDNSRRREAEMHTALMRILDDAALFGWESNAVQAARRVARDAAQPATGK